MRLSILSIILIGFICSAGTATQTDWSGGPDQYGPVSSFGNSFYSVASIFWSENPGYLLLVDNIENPMPSYWYRAEEISAVDLDDDGDLDIVGTDCYGNDVTWFENVDGLGTEWTMLLVYNNLDQPTSHDVADIDGDGDLDIPVSCAGNISSGDQLCWMENLNGIGTSWEYHHIYDVNNSWGVSAADIDNDGDMDIVGSSVIEDRIIWCENLVGTGTTWSVHTIAEPFESAAAVLAFDLNGDGFIDVIGTGADELCWWRNEGDSGLPTWSKMDIDDDIGGWPRIIRCADINGDGRIDILVGDMYNDMLAWWEQTGTGWTRNNVAYCHGAWGVDADDLDGDGDLDIAAGAYHGDELAVWWNLDGSGTSWEKQNLGTYISNPTSVDCADLNGDGSPDVLCASLSDRITWWNLVEHMPCGSLESSVLDTGTEPVWGYFDWSADTPSGCAVSFQLRASDNYTDMGEWSDTLTTAGPLGGILGDGKRFVQYRAILSTSDPENTPVLDYVTISWVEVSIDETEQPMVFGLNLRSNPVRGTAIIDYSVPTDVFVLLSVYDLSGRLLVQPVAETVTDGHHSIYLGQFEPGTYMCRMAAGGFLDTRRFVVLE